MLRLDFVNLKLIRINEQIFAQLTLSPFSFGEAITGCMHLSLFLSFKSNVKILSSNLECNDGDQ